MESQELLTALQGLIAERDALQAENATLRRKLDTKKRAVRYLAAAGRTNAALIALARPEPTTVEPPALPDLVPAWSDKNDLALLRAVWPTLTAVERADMAPGLLLNDFCAPRHQRSYAFHALVRRAADLPRAATTPAEVSAQAVAHA